MEAWADKWRLRWRMIAHAVRAYARLADAYLWNHRRLPPEHRRPLALRLLFIVGYPLLAPWTALFLWLDDVVFWGWRRVALPPPLFIVGNPRSGTTVLHRIVAKDVQRFFCLYPTDALLPSLLQQTVLKSMATLDRLVGSPVRRWLERAEKRPLKATEHLHHNSLFLPDEDEHVLDWLLAAIHLPMLFPGAGFDKLFFFDEQVSEPDQMALMTFYESSVRRHAIAGGRGRRLLSKNPIFTGRIRALCRQFPEARFIYSVRHPFETTGSILNSARTTLRMAFREEPGPDLEEKSFAMIRHYYLVALAELDQLPADRVAFVRYDDLMSRPRETIEGVYRHFGMSITPEYSTALDQDIAQMKAYSSKHKYNLEGCPITPQQIINELSSVFERFGFDAGGLQPSQVAAAALPAGSSSTLETSPARSMACRL